MQPGCLPGYRWQGCCSSSPRPGELHWRSRGVGGSNCSGIACGGRGCTSCSGCRHAPPHGCWSEGDGIRQLVQCSHIAAVGQLTTIVRDVDLASYCLERTAAA